MKGKRNKRRLSFMNFRKRLKRLRKSKSSKSSMESEETTTVQEVEIIDVIDVEQRPGPSLAEVDMLEPLEGVNWKNFKKFKQVNTEDNDVVEVPRSCRSKKEIEDELKALKVKKKRQIKNKTKEESSQKSKEASIDDEIVFLGSFPATNKASPSQQTVPPTIFSVPFHKLHESKSIPIQELRPFRSVLSEVANNRFIDRPGFNIRICTFNVLCEETKKKHPFLYVDQSQKMSWEQRKALIMSEVISLNSNVYLMQEVQHDHFLDFFEPLFHRIGFKCIYTRRKGIQNVDGCLLAYKTNMFKELRFEHVYYNYECKNFNKDNVGQIILLEENQTGLKFVVACTHILFNMKRGDVKTGQIALLIASIDKFCSDLRFDGKFAGVFLCGDFNIEPNSPIYDFIRNGILPYSMFTSSQLPLNPKIREQTSQDVEIRNPLAVTPFCVMPSVPLDPNNCELINLDLSNKQMTSVPVICHKHFFLSAYRHMIDEEMEVSTYHRDHGCPDFIFYTGQQSSDNKVEEGRIMLRKILVLPTLRMIESACGKMPNDQCGSDHLPLMAEFFVC